MTMLFLLAIAIFAIAVLYSSAGYGGGTGYVAVIALAGLAPEEIRATALTLNIIVTSIATVQFVSRGHGRLDLLLPFLLGSVPAAFIAGRWLTLDPAIYRGVLGVIFLYAAMRVWAGRRFVGTSTRRAPLPVALATGAGIGLISGLIGIGGGIFLGPLLLIMRWATPQQTAGVTAPFILVNSIAAIFGLMLSPDGLGAGVPNLLIWGAAAGLGGIIGANLGSRRLPPTSLRLVLTVILVIAAINLILS